MAQALLALCPFIVLTTAAALFEGAVVKDLAATKFATQLTAGLANAAYAFGAVASADLIQRFPARRLFLACELGFVAGSLLAGLAGGIALFMAGRLVQGLATGMLLVAALPPLVTGHGAERLPTTAAFINLGLFGMVTLGPLVGGLPGGIQLAIAITLAFTVLSGVVLVSLYLLGGARPHEPDLEGWLDGDETAYDSPPVLDRVRAG